jgi:hypothetical protein
MFQPMVHPFPFQRGPVRVVVDAAAAAVARCFDRIAAPKRNALAEFLTTFVPHLSMFVDFMKAPLPQTAIAAGSDTNEIKQQLHAHELRLNSLSDLLFGDILKAATVDDSGEYEDNGHNGTK